MYDAETCDALVGSSLQLMTHTDLTVSLWRCASGLDGEWSNL